MSELPKGWLETTLGEVVDYGTTLKAEPDEIAGDEWVLELEDIEKDKSKIVGRFTFADRKSKSTKNRFSKGDVLYGKLRPYLNKVVLADSDGLCTTEIVPIKQTSAVDNRYVFHWLKGPCFLNYATGISHGLNMPRLGTDAGRRAPFILAPLAEQKRIADKLDSVLARVDGARAKLERVPVMLKRFRQAVLMAAISGKLTAEWRLARNLQEDWKAVTLSEVASDFAYGTSAKSLKEGIVPVLRMGNIQNGKIDWGDLVFTSDNAEIVKYRVQKGDVLFNRTNSPELVGKSAVFKGEREAVYAGYLIRVRCSEQLHPDYINYCLASPYGRDWCWRVKTDGVSQSNINAKKLAAFEFGLPSIDEQHEIIERAESLFAIADKFQAQYERAIELLERLTPSLLAKAFRGELVLQDPSDEPAEKLLERLKARTTSLGTKDKRSKRSSTAAAEIE